jgi:predicted methyltransferase
MHDPPRFSFAGELYSLEFYKELFRILKTNGRIFHYLGNPKKNTLKKGVKRRLEEAGFEKLNWIENCKGFTAQKSFKKL